MVKRFIIVFSFIFAAGVFEGSADVIEFHYNGSIFQDLGSWWMHDWTRAYEKDPEGNFLLDPDGKLIHVKTWIFNTPSYFLDGWHFLKLLLILSYLTCVAFLVFYPITSIDLATIPRFLLFTAILLTFRTSGFYLAWKLF